MTQESYFSNQKIVQELWFRRNHGAGVIKEILLQKHAQIRQKS